MLRTGRKHRQRGEGGGVLKTHAQFAQPKLFFKRARENSSEFKDLEDDPDSDFDV